jgi:uroporphyrinogen-III synthase
VGPHRDETRSPCEAASDRGLRIDPEANPHKMGLLVRAAAEHAPAIIPGRTLRRTD